MTALYPAAGCRRLSINPHHGEAPLRCHVLYPSASAASNQRFGRYPVNLALDAAPAPGPWPLVVISHGNGGTPWTHRDLAVDLARHGYLVALPEHAGNCVGDNRLAGTLANLENRPRQLSQTIDAALAEPWLAELGAGPQVAVIGHSLGAYSALAAAGGQPVAAGWETPDGRAQAVTVTADPRIAALVLLAPAAARFAAPRALAAVTVPIQIWAAELDSLTPPAEAKLIVAGLADPDQASLQRVAGAGHYSFLSPFPAEFNRPDFAPAHDPPGFDRIGLQAHLHASIRQFLQAQRPR